MCWIQAIIIYFVLSIVQISYGEMCQSSSGELGTCTHLSECSGNYTPHDFCGSIDKVCCIEINKNRIKRSENRNDSSSCRNSDGKNGLCVRISQCSTTRNIHLTRTQYLYRTRNNCSDDKKYVCCDKNNTINTIKRSAPVRSCLLQNGSCELSGKCPRSQIIGNVSDCSGRRVCCLPRNNSGKNKLELLPIDCGLNNNLGTRISHGQTTDIIEHPWMALLVNKMAIPKTSTQYLNYRCGGFIISKRYVISAAHCVHGIDHQFFYIRLGEWDYNSEVDCYNDVCSGKPIDIEIQQIKIQPNYTTTSIDNDIALIRLNKTVKFNLFIKPICLPIAEHLRNEVFDGTLLEIAGWGKTHHGEVSSRKLKATVTGITNNDCSKMYEGEIFSFGQMCAGGNDNHGSCRGDSGGPLMYYDLDATLPHWIAVGISAAGPELCGIGNKPSIYTRVSTQLDWILNNIHA